jgi:hypothetical protein
MRSSRTHLSPTPSRWSIRAASSGTAAAASSSTGSIHRRPYNPLYLPRQAPERNARTAVCERAQPREREGNRTREIEIEREREAAGSRAVERRWTGARTLARHGRRTRAGEQRWESGLGARTRARERRWESGSGADVKPKLVNQTKKLGSGCYRLMNR